MRRSRWPSAEARFDARAVKPTDPNGCWLWSGPAGKRGYAPFTVDGIGTYAHRYSYERFVGPIPDGLFVCHHCDVRNCVNPAHLFVGTVADNAHDMIRKGRDRKARGEERARKLNDVAVMVIRTSRAPRRLIAALYGISWHTVAALRNGKTWAHLPLVQRDGSRCLRGHSWTQESTYTRPNGHRMCRECAKEREAQRRDTKNASRREQRRIRRTA